MFEEYDWMSLYSDLYANDCDSDSELVVKDCDSDSEPVTKTSSSFQ